MQRSRNSRAIAASLSVVFVATAMFPLGAAAATRQEERTYKVSQHERTKSHDYGRKHGDRSRSAGEKTRKSDADTDRKAGKHDHREDKNEAESRSYGKGKSDRSRDKARNVEKPDKRDQSKHRDEPRDKPRDLSSGKHDKSGKPEKGFDEGGHKDAKKEKAKDWGKLRDKDQHRDKDQPKDKSKHHDSKKGKSDHSKKSDFEKRGFEKKRDSKKRHDSYKKQSQVALYVDGRFAFNLTPAEAGSWANGIYVGMPASSPGFGRLEFDNLRIAPKATTFGLVEWLPQPWAQRLTFDDQLNPDRCGWALKNHGNLTSGYDTSTGSWYVSDNNNSADTEYSYMTGAVATSITFSADVKTEQKPGQSFTQGAGIRISDGQTEYLVKLSLDSIQDGHGSASVAVDLAGGFHNIRITKGPSGATLIVDGVEAFDLTGVSTSANELAFGVVASSAGQGLVYFDNVTVGP